MVDFHSTCQISMNTQCTRLTFCLRAWVAGLVLYGLVVFTCFHVDQCFTATNWSALRSNQHTCDRICLCKKPSQHLPYATQRPHKAWAAWAWLKILEVASHETSVLIHATLGQATTCHCGTWRFLSLCSAQMLVLLLKTYTCVPKSAVLVGTQDGCAFCFAEKLHGLLRR